MVLQINSSSGSVVILDLIPYVAHKGIKLQKNDIDSQSTVRNLQGNMIRNRINTKVKINVTCKPLTTSEAHTLFNALSGQTLNVSFTDPYSGTVRTTTMYTNNNTAAVCVIKNPGTVNEIVFWEDITFPLIEL